MITDASQRKIPVSRERARLGEITARVLREYWLTAVLLAAFFGGWEAVIRLFRVPVFVFPSISEILVSMGDQRDVLLGQTWPTLEVIGLGLVAGAAAGLILAILMTHSRTIERGLYPILIASQAIPVPAIASPLVIWLGYNIFPRVIVVVLIVFFPIVINEFIGLTNVDQELLNLMRSMGASRWMVFRHVRFPSSLPLLFAGLKLAAIYSVIGAVFGEWVGSDRGLGAYLQQQNAQLRSDRVFADIFVLSAIGVLLFLLTGLLERLSTPWRRQMVN